MKSNVTFLPIFQPTESNVVHLDPANRKRLLRYKAKKASLAINPRTFFKLEVIKHV